MYHREKVRNIRPVFIKILQVAGFNMGLDE